MAHFARLDENNIVVEVLVVSNADIQDLPFPVSEEVGVSYLNSFLPVSTWKQTSYNGNFRFRYAGIGDTFHAECGEYGGFAKERPSEDFLWDASQCAWIPPIPYPTDGVEYFWSFEKKQWSPVPQQGPNTTTIG